MKIIITLMLSILIMSSFAAAMSTEAVMPEQLNTPKETNIDNHEEQSITVCDHNGDGIRDLTDVTLFAQCKDTFDANEDGTHDLTDIALYAQHHNDNEWCAKAVSECAPEDINDEDTLIVCDHNADGKRDLTDVTILAQYKDTFDVNGDGKHDLTDLGLYTQNYNNDTWCAEHNDQFSENEDEDIMVCDHNNDGKRDLTDVSILAQYKDTFDVNGDGTHDLSDIALYAQHHNDNEWCFEHRDQFGEDDEHTITLHGDNPRIIELGDDYVELGAEVSNGNDDDITIDTSDLNIHSVGSYTISYEYEDAETVTRTVIIQDTTNPHITVSTSPRHPEEDEHIDINIVVRDESLVTIEVEVEFDNEIVKTFDADNVDTEISFDYKPRDDGDYTITVTATDTEGNSVTEELDVEVDKQSSSSSSRRRSSSNVGEVRVITSTPSVDEEIQLNEDEAESNIEIRTIDMDDAEEIVPNSDEDLSERDNLITGAVTGSSDTTTKIWLAVLILLIVLAVLAILYVTVWSKN